MDVDVRQRVEQLTRHPPPHAWMVAPDDERAALLEEHARMHSRLDGWCRREREIDVTAR
jgi:hypothetical protein